LFQKFWSQCTLSQKNANISAQGLRILDLRPALKTSLNSTRSFQRHVYDLATKYLSKKSFKLTNVEKTQTFENFVKGRSRLDFNETCLGHLGPSLIHPRSWFLLTILFDLRSLQENRVDLLLSAFLVVLFTC
jgi:hypothetical protein